MTGADASLQLAEMRTVAFRLGMAFGQAAETADDLDRKLKLFDAFHQCFASVRLAIALDMRLKKAPTVTAERETERVEVLEREPLEIERAERPERYTERDRDRESERASFPLLLRTLERVAADAEELLPVPPAELPTLRELLAQAQATPALEPPASTGLRTRLTGSTATQVLARPGLHGPPLRRSTRPPHR